MTKEELITLIEKSEVPADYLYKFFMCAEECYRIDNEEEAPTP